MPRLDENIDALVNAFGVSNVGLIWGLANVNWRDAAHRDTFIDLAVRGGFATFEAFALNAGAAYDAIPGLPDRPVNPAPVKKYAPNEPNPRGGLGGVEGWPLVGTSAVA